MILQSDGPPQSDDQGDQNRSSLVEYRHTDDYQGILRQALLHASAREEKISDSLLAEELSKKNVEFDRSSISRFRSSKTASIKDEKIAQALWDILVEYKVIDFRFVRRHSRLSLDEIALQTNLFLETHQSQFDGILKGGCYGLFFGYKRSFRRNGIVKSLFLIAPRAGHLGVTEYQQSRATREADGGTKIERSDGFAVVKSGNIWLFMKEKEYQQPRLFCFDARESIELPDRRQDNIIKGHCLETSKKYSTDRGAKYSPVMLVRARGTVPDDYANFDLFNELKKECDLIPVPEFRTAPYQSPPDTPHSVLHPAIEDYVLGNGRFS